jgi:hypothetical protein
MITEEEIKNASRFFRGRSEGIGWHSLIIGGGRGRI